MFDRIPANALPALTLACLLAPFAAQAQEQVEDAASQATPWRVGLGVASFARPYTGSDKRIAAFPNISYENEYVRIAGLGVDLKLGSAEGFRFSLRTKYALGDGYKSGDAPILDGMATRRGSLWLGPAVRWNTELGRLSFEVMGDALGKSKGLQAKLGAEHDFRFGSFMLTPHLGAEFVDKKYVDYYYGVMGSEATARRAAYTGRSTVNAEAGLRLGFGIDARNTVFADATVKAYGKGITDSSLVDKKTAPGFFLGYVHRF